MTALYHFTDSAHLPRIIRDGELRPILCVPRDFVHATDNEDGERTATVMWGDGPRLYRAGKCRRVRFTLDAADFEPWLEVLSRFPEWTADKIERLERTARNRKQSTAGWFCRADALPLAKLTAAHSRSYVGHKWEPFDPASLDVKEATTDRPQFGVDCLGVELGGTLYMSVREKLFGGLDVYRYAEPRKIAA